MINIQDIVPDRAKKSGTSMDNPLLTPTKLKQSLLKFLGSEFPKLGLREDSIILSKSPVNDGERQLKSVNSYPNQPSSSDIIATAGMDLYAAKTANVFAISKYFPSSSEKTKTELFIEEPKSADISSSLINSVVALSKIELMTTKEIFSPNGFFPADQENIVTPGVVESKLSLPVRVISHLDEIIKNKNCPAELKGKLSIYSEQLRRNDFKDLFR
jgi:hypothetical protein